MPKNQKTVTPKTKAKVKAVKAKPKKTNVSSDLSANPALASFMKVMIMCLLFGGGLYFASNKSEISDGSLSSSLIGMDTMEQKQTIEKIKEEKRTLRIQKFFPPQKLKFKDWNGVTRVYPFFQRSRTFVPRFQFADGAESGWTVDFILDEGTEKERLNTVDKDLNKTVKTRFLHVDPGKHDLTIRVKDKEGEIVHEIQHDQIWILDKVIVLYGDQSLRGDFVESFIDENTTPKSKLFPAAKFAAPVEYEPKTFGHGLDLFLEKAYAEKGKTVFPVNLMQYQESPGDVPSRYLSDGRKDRLFSIDGKIEHESFLGVDEIWIAYHHEAMRRGLSPEALVDEISVMTDDFHDRGLTSDQIVLLLPTFSAESNMKDFREPLTQFAQERGYRIGPDHYVSTRAEYGKFVSLDHDPIMTKAGMEHVAQELVDWDTKQQ